MYIRQSSRKNKDGTVVRYLQLAQKVRDPNSGTPRDEVLYHFGREDQIDRAQIQRLIDSLSRFLEPSDRSALNARLQKVTASDLEVGQPIPWGGSFLLDALWRRLEIDRTLTRLLAARSFQVDIERSLFALVANRALAPCSKLAIESWVGTHIHIEGLPQVAVHNLYRAMDFLIAHHEEVQKSVFFSVASLLNLQVDLLFFDTTSTYFEVDEIDPEDEEELRQYGNSKDHRPDLPQVVIGLAVTRQGLPVRCWVLEGNTADASLVKQVQEDLAGWRLNRVVWAMDRGFTGEEQRIALQRGGGHAILGEKLRGQSTLNAEALQRPGRYSVVRDNLEVKEVEVENGSNSRRFLVVRNPRQAVRDKAVRDRLLARLEEKLTKANEQVRRGGKEHPRAICELKAHRTYPRFLRELKSGELRIDRSKVAEDEKLDGKYLLSTTDKSLSAEDAVLGYKQLLEVERAFRTMKTTLEARPIHYRLADRIKAHILLCWLALLMVRMVELETGSTWDRVRDQLEGISLVPLNGPHGTSTVCSRLNPAQLNILKTLKIDPPKHLHAFAPSTPKL